MMPFTGEKGITGKVGLGEIQSLLRYGAPLIGELVEWPLEQMPHEIWPDMTMEFIPYMAQSFDPDKYPLLAQLHPAHVLPVDMRGEFPRGWDNGRGVDIGRTLLSAQLSGAPEIEGGGFIDYTVTNTAGTGAFKSTPVAGSGAGIQGSGSAGFARTLKFKASDADPTYGRATEVRSRNVAWNMIVRAK